MKPGVWDRSFLTIVALLSIVGFVVFWSASLGLLSRGGESNFNVVVFKQLTILSLGWLTLMFCSRLPFMVWHKLGLPILIVAVGLSLLVLVPGLGVETGGARRWLILGPLSFQPAELLKLGFILFLAGHLARFKQDIQTIKYGLLPFLLTSGAIALVFIFQPDIDKIFIFLGAGTAMYFLAGARWHHLLLVFAVGVTALAGLILYKPYILNRIETYFNPENDVLGSSYQINQSLIAIGSGGIFGRGFGKGIQKFQYLPEPINDSIFAVASEEFGFLGGSLLIILFVAFALAGFKIAARAPNLFGRLLVAGIIIMIVMETLTNIASMLGVVPLSGTPLLFVSQGGTALLFALGGSGIILNVSRYR